MPLTPQTDYTPGLKIKNGQLSIRKVSNLNFDKNMISKSSDSDMIVNDPDASIDDIFLYMDFSIARNGCGNNYLRHI